MAKPRLLFLGLAFLTFSVAPAAHLQAQTAATASQTPTPPSPSSSAPNSAPAAAQTAALPIAYDTQPLPRDPAAALLLASKANGLGDDGMKPWYLKAHYQTFDAQGKPAAKGFFELYWAAKDRYRVTYADDSFTQTTYHLPEADYVIGSAERLPYADTLIWPAIMHPVVVREKASVPELHERKFGQVQLTCLEFRYSDGTPADAYCLDAEKSILRAADQEGYTEVYNHIGIFQHHYSAAQVSVREGQQQVLVLDRDTLRGILPEDGQALVPPTDARTVPHPIKDDTDQGLSSLGGTAALQVAARVLSGHTTVKVPPIYPAMAKQRGAQGTVRIAATIGKDGLVHNPVVVHDPDALLSQAALNAVSQWRYTPYLLNGVPVAVDTVILVHFMLGR